MERFQSTPLIRGATARGRRPCGSAPDFNPRPSYEGRLWGRYTGASSGKFQSTPLIRGATVGQVHGSEQRQISIHAPHTRGDPITLSRARQNWAFQSTPLIRGATVVFMAGERRVIFQSTPLIRGATLGDGPRGRFHEISIHAPHTRGDQPVTAESILNIISIHAPHTRGDDPVFYSYDCLSNFNPRPSYEGRLSASMAAERTDSFQSTPLIRGATRLSGVLVGRVVISIHAPHTRGDSRGSLRTQPR